MDHRCTKSGDSFFSGRTHVNEFMSKLKNKIITNQSIEITGRRGYHFEENYHFVPGLFLTSRYRYAERFLIQVPHFIQRFGVILSVGSPSHFVHCLLISINLVNVYRYIPLIPLTIAVIQNNKV